MNLSVQYNGVELSELLYVLDGYTIHGGANWEPSYNEIKGINGAEYIKTRYKAKTIPMPFAMKEKLNKKYDALQQALNVDEPKTLIFENAPDRYFLAIPEGDLNFDEINKNGGKGEIKWLVCDGLAHSLVKKEFTASLNDDGVLEATIVNNGSEAVPIDYEITHNHENGYIGIASEYGAIELGRIDEEDNATANKSVTLVDFTKYADFDAMTTGSGITSEKTYGKNGSFKEINYKGRSWITLNSLGSGSYYKGACKTMTIPADENGEVGATNFKAQCRVDYETVKRARQTGILQFVIGDENDEVLALIYFNKNSKTSNTACYRCRVGKQDKNKITFTPNYQNLTTKSGNLISITKTGGLFAFDICGKKYQFRDDTLAEKKAKTITIFMGNMPGAVESFMSTSSNLGRMLLTDLSFRKDNVTYTYDIPNRYPEGCVVKVDGETTKVYVDDVESPGDEVKGADYFHAPPGETKVRFYHSEFSDPVPTFKAYIREAYT